jgi:hypothetical protein
MSQSASILKITPTRSQFNRFIIWHTHVSCHGSSYRMEEFVIQLKAMDREYNKTGSITLDDEYMIENWQDLKNRDFIIDEDHPYYPPTLIT